MKEATHTAKTQYRKFETNIPRKGIARPQFQYPLHVSAIYTFTPSVCLFYCRKICGPILGIADRHMYVEIGTEATQFLFWEYVNGIFVAVQFIHKCIQERMRRWSG